MERPETRYAWNGDISLAYQVVGEGPVDLIYLQGYCSHVDMNWESPHLARFLRGLSGHVRLVVTDRRGWGCSDRFSPSDVPPLETLTDDLLAVMKTVASERALIFATWDCVLQAALFAATYPDRVLGLVLCGAMATYVATDETPWMHSEKQLEEESEEVRSLWGTPAWRDTVPADDLDWWARYQRASVAPGALIAEIGRYAASDVRPVLPSIQAPTLVLSDSDGTIFNAPDNGQYLASHIPGARLVEFSGRNEFHWYEPSATIVRQEIARFIASIREEEATFHRVLATVMFTDIVDSTGRAAELGDRRWKESVERHHRLVRTLLARYGGQEVDTAGDGFFATFDGPARGVRCAQAIAGAVKDLGIEIRAGVHTGEVEMIAGKVGGIAVNIGARIAALAGPSEVLVSHTVEGLVSGSGLMFEDVGQQELKGVPERWHLYRVLE
jgi:class 3 adenylate cyclase